MLPQSLMRGLVPRASQLGWELGSTCRSVAANAFDVLDICSYSTVSGKSSGEQPSPSSSSGPSDSRETSSDRRPRQQRSRSDPSMSSSQAGPSAITSDRQRSRAPSGRSAQEGYRRGAPALITPASVPDLAKQNAPTQVLELIGDPRSGVADDVTHNPFGGMTVDMVHHQPSNEVYWYKYEFSGGQTKGSHRDGRLSEYSKNLMYLLRAKDPARWSIDALARKFRVRKQRVLAILALKEMEGQAMERGEALPGPLSAYAVPVRLSDLVLDPTTGEPVGLDPEGSISDAVAAADADAAKRASDAPPPSSVLQGSGVGAGEDQAVLALHNALPRLATLTQHVQLQLLAALKAYNYDLGALRSELTGALQSAEDQLAALAVSLPQPSPAPAEGDKGSAAAPTAADPLAAAKAAVADQKAATTALLDALDAMLLQPAAAVPAAAAGAEGSAAAGDGAAADAVTSAPERRAFRSYLLDEQAVAVTDARSLAAALQPAGGEAALTAALRGVEGDRLLRAVLGLPLALRTSLIATHKPTAAALNAMGVDLTGITKQVAYTLGGSGASQAQGKNGSDEAPVSSLVTDLLGWSYIPASQYTAVQAALQQLGGAEDVRLPFAAPPVVAPQGATATSPASAAGAGSSSADEAAAGSPGAAAALLASLGRISETYRSALGAVQRLESDVQQLDSQTGRDEDVRPATSAASSLLDALAAGDDGARRAVLRLMQEAAGPGVLQRVELAEAVEQLQRAGDTVTAAAVRAKLREAAGQAPAPVAAGADGGEGAPAPGSPAAEAAAHAVAGALGTGSWDALAAWLEAVPGGRVFHRGSGERNTARMATYPAFEGYPLSALDSANESELSALNRQVAAKQEDQLMERFASNLLFNLGLVGEEVWDPSRVRPPGNRSSSLQVAPIVVYNISQDGNTVYPPLFVVERDGKQRALSEKEKVWQERRKELKPLPYMITRVKRKPEQL